MECDVMPNYFGMVTTRGSREYTPLAINSFFAHTELEADDKFFLIDNDGSHDTQGLLEEKITVIKNEKPLSFAKNVNQILGMCFENIANLFFQNNDIIFEKGCFPPLVRQNSITLPTCNQYEQ